MIPRDPRPRPGSRCVGNHLCFIMLFYNRTCENNYSLLCLVANIASAMQVQLNLDLHLDLDLVEQEMPSWTNCSSSSSNKIESLQHCSPPAPPAGGHMGNSRTLVQSLN